MGAGRWLPVDKQLPAGVPQKAKEERREGEQVGATVMRAQKDITIADELDVRDRQDIYKNFLMYCMTGDVVRGPMGVVMNVERDEADFARLSQLGDILGLDQMQVSTIHRDLAEQAFKAQVRDGARAAGRHHGIPPNPRRPRPRAARIATAGSSRSSVPSSGTPCCLCHQRRAVQLDVASGAVRVEVLVTLAAHIHTAFYENPGGLSPSGLFQRGRTSISLPAHAYLCSHSPVVSAAVFSSRFLVVSPPCRLPVRTPRPSVISSTPGAS